MSSGLIHAGSTYLKVYMGLHSAKEERQQATWRAATGPTSHMDGLRLSGSPSSPLRLTNLILPRTPPSNRPERARLLNEAIRSRSCGSSKCSTVSSWRARSYCDTALRQGTLNDSFGRRSHGHPRSTAQAHGAQPRSSSRCWTAQCSSARWLYKYSKRCWATDRPEITRGYRPTRGSASSSRARPRPRPSSQRSTRTTSQDQPGIGLVQHTYHANFDHSYFTQRTQLQSS